MSSTRRPSNGKSGAARPAVRLRGRPAARRRCRRSECSPSSGAGAGWPQAPPRPAGRAGPGWPTPSAGWRRRSARRRKWSRSRHVRAVGDRSVGDAEGRGQLQHLFDGALGDPGVDRRGRSAVRSRKSLGSSIHSGCSTMAQKSSHCWPGAAPQADQPVACRTDARGRDVAAAAQRSSQLVVEGHRVVGEAHGQRLEHRHVDQLARRFGARRRAARVPIAAKSPASHSPICPPTCTGGTIRVAPGQPDDPARTTPAG